MLWRERVVRLPVGKRIQGPKKQNRGRNEPRAFTRRKRWVPGGSLKRPSWKQTKKVAVRALDLIKLWKTVPANRKSRGGEKNGGQAVGDATSTKKPQRIRDT